LHQKAQPGEKDSGLDSLERLLGHMKEPLVVDTGLFEGCLGLFDFEKVLQKAGGKNRANT
jgi:hypothetical protein